MKTPKQFYFRKASDVPNNPLPVLIFRAVLSRNSKNKARRFRETFRGHGWVGIWTDTIYDYTHFHSNAHEVLGIAEGKVELRLGGARGRTFNLQAGDVVVLPAGVGHRRTGSDEGLKVVGAYPHGQASFNIKRKGHRTPRVGLPRTDPVFGKKGPLILSWGESRHA